MPDRPHPRLDPSVDPVGCWRTVRQGAARPFTIRVLAYSEDSQPLPPNGALAPKRVDLRRVDGNPENIANPIYVSTPTLALVTLQCRYYDGTTPLGAILVAGEFACNEDGDAHAGEVRREVQRRLDAGSLWTVSNTSLLVQRYLGDSVTALGEQVPLPPPVNATRVEYVAYVPDPVATDGARLTKEIEASIAAAAIKSQFPEAVQATLLAIILREISVAQRWKESLSGLVEKAI